MRKSLSADVLFPSSSTPEGNMLPWENAPVAVISVLVHTRSTPAIGQVDGVARARDFMGCGEGRG